MKTSGKQYIMQERSRLKDHYPQLNDLDLQYEDGKHAEMIRKVAKKLGVTPMEVHSVVAPR